MEGNYLKHALVIISIYETCWLNYVLVNDIPTLSKCQDQLISPKEQWGSKISFFLGFAGLCGLSLIKGDSTWFLCAPPHLRLWGFICACRHFSLFLQKIDRKWAGCEHGWVAEWPNASLCSPSLIKGKWLCFLWRETQNRRRGTQEGKLEH